VSCIKPDGHDPDNCIDGIGGLNDNGTRWYLKEDEAIAGIESRKWEFYVKVNDREVDVIVAKTSTGKKYLKTVADDYKPNNLLRLPKCPD